MVSSYANMQALHPSELSHLERSAVGLASGAATAVITCPIDVVNTHLKAGLVERAGISSTMLRLATVSRIDLLPPACS